MAKKHWKEPAQPQPEKPADKPAPAAAEPEVTVYETAHGSNALSSKVVKKS
jgi:hypothetical protein